MSGNETKRQHYVPRTYLRHFSEPEGNEHFIHRLPIANCVTEEIQRTNIINVCLQNHLYSLEGDTIEDRQRIEKFYSNSIESEYENIYSILTDPLKKTVTEEERAMIITTVVTMLYRTTKWISRHTGFADQVTTYMFQLCQQKGKDSYFLDDQEISIKGKSLEELLRENKEESKKAHTLTHLEVAFKLITLRDQNDGISVAKLENGSEFISSDNPVMCSNIRNSHISPFDPTNILKLPLDAEHMLFLHPYAESERKYIIQRDCLNGFGAESQRITSNYTQFTNAERFLLGSESGLKEYIATKEIWEKPYDK